ncbi:MAG TPA: FAD-dependent oxidoreductase, partial [Beutenbergiaceae bacterium]|nr:FAD-dependent oxidoreductase [Beutenbergiaceae bacterium]
PFEIPLGALIPQTRTNLLAGCKNIGTTHITNGCYRLHPVEWNIGEAAGVLAATCLADDTTPHQVHADPALVTRLQERLVADGVELAWPDGVYGY